MAERSIEIHQTWRDAALRFDYFILGLTTALLAFMGQTVDEIALGYRTSAAVYLLAILVLIISAYFGFRRIESLNTGFRLNHQWLALHERRGALVRVVIEGRDAVDHQTGEIHTPHSARTAVDDLTNQLDDVNDLLAKNAERAERRYTARNALLAGGFLLLVLAKIVAASE